jgi:eukaryotic-like serine/threonine-protein kinase
MAGEYRLLRKLGEGGFGAVYEAEHPLLKRRAAVKVLHRVADQDSDAVQRFISEAQAVNQIRNRHIVDVFSFGKLSDGRHFYVMDLLDGEPLDRFIKHHGRVDVSTALQLLSPIADALDLAHRAGIVHRDLKPQNIFLAWDFNGETVPKLLDFGMAKLLGDSSVHTVSGTPIGTPLYMSPEQARGERVDQRSDVYALGVLCFELLTGHLPFTGDSTVAVLMAHIIQAAPRPSEVCSELSPLLDEPLLRMLDKDPEHRPASAGEAIAALRSAAMRAGISLSDAPLHLPRPSAGAPSEPARGEPDTLLDDGASTEPDVAARGVSTSGAGRSLWPFAVGLMVFGGALAVVVMSRAHGDATVAADSPSSAAVPTEAPSTASEPTAAAPSSTAPAAPSASATSSAAPTPGEPKRIKVSKPPPASTPARIPTDLEDPF